jgi:hypothetical protein
MAGHRNVCERTEQASDERVDVYRLKVMGVIHTREADVKNKYTPTTQTPDSETPHPRPRSPPISLPPPKPHNKGEKSNLTSTASSYVAACFRSASLTPSCTRARSASVSVCCHSVRAAAPPPPEAVKAANCPRASDGCDRPAPPALFNVCVCVCVCVCVRVCVCVCVCV